MVKCPCCQQNRGQGQIQYVFGLMEEVGKSAFLEPECSPQEFLEGKGIPWACDICIDNGVAELVNPVKEHKSWYPYFSYYDTPLNCVWCGLEFNFSKQEKRDWFENFRFSFEFMPVHCENCRTEFREGTPEQERCNVLLEKGPDNLSEREKNELIAIYKSWNQQSTIRY